MTLTRRELQVALVAVVTMLALLVLPSSASAVIYTVDTLADGADDGECVTDCTLREAITLADQFNGMDDIHFSVAGTINATGAMPTIDFDTEINGTTAPGASIGDPTVEVDGTGAGAANGFNLFGNGFIQTLAINNFSGAGINFGGFGSQNAVVGSYIGLDLDGVTAQPNGIGLRFDNAFNTFVGNAFGGGRNVISGNTGPGIQIINNNNGISIQNNFIGTNAAGTAAVPNGGAGVTVTGLGGSVDIGGGFAGADNVISGNMGAGVSVSTGSSIEIKGNRIGTNALGTAALPNAGSAGIHLLGTATNVQVGGATADEGNLISGNTSDGVLIAGVSGNFVNRNLIGTNAAGTGPLGNGGNGVALTTTASNNVIGAFGTGNVIAFNGSDGISQTGTGTGNLLSGGNSIHSNTGLGVDLVADGVTPNDPVPDADVGPNGLLNFPVITSASSTPISTTISGTVAAQPNTHYVIAIYTNPTCDGSGFGEARTLLARENVVTDGVGNAPFTFSTETEAPLGNDEVTAATINAADGTSSELAQCVTIARGINFTVDSTADAVDVSPGNGTCATAGAVCTLRAAVQEANAFAGPDAISVPAGTYSLTIPGMGENAAATGDLDITQQVAIFGESARLTSVTETTGDRTFHVTAGVAGVTLADMEIFGASTTQFGAGVFNQGNLTITRAAIRNNTSSGGGGGGGGVSNDTGGILKLRLSEVSGNSAINGGGLFNSSATMSVTNSTISGNLVPGGGFFGGGIRTLNAGASLTVSYSTIANNTGPNPSGISLGAGVTATVSSSILSNNANGNCNGAVTSGDNNVEGPGAPTCLTAPGPDDVTNVDPLLGALANNGGPTDTRALGALSPAIDNGDPATCPLTDQRLFLRFSGAACDSGAFEVGAALPNTIIDSGPPATSNDPTPTFNFSSDIPGSTFECSLDTGIPLFGPCSGAGTHTPAPLADGTYTFRVRAIDPALNPDLTPATSTFTIDTTDPDSTIDSGPGGLTNDSTPTFTFSSDPGSTFECSVDTGVIKSLAPCSGAGAHTPAAPLADGLWNFRVRATDPASNQDPTPATFNFTVDATPPDSTIDSGPSGTIADATPTFTFSANEASSFQCSLDTGTPVFNPCSGAFTPATALADGSYTFRVRGGDAAGNVEPTPATRAFTVETAPTPSNGDTVAAEPVSGTVKIKVPGSGRYVILRDGDEIPVGTHVDAEKGRVEITSISPTGVTQTALFYAGRFQVLQPDGATIVTLKLEGGNFRRCPPRRSGRGSAAKPLAPTAVVRKLWGRGRGRFQTRGRGGAGTVRGTKWLTADRCDGTLFKVREGVVAVRDFGLRKTVTVRAGKKYLARLR